MKDINAIHQAIDVPTALDKQLKEELGIDGTFMGLDSGGAHHRKFNHDPYIGLAKAMRINPERGFEIYMSHMFMDYLSNSIRDALGTEGRDMAELVLNRYLRSVNSSIPKTYSKKFKNPFFNGPPTKPNPLKKIMRRNKFYKIKQKSSEIW